LHAAVVLEARPVESDPLDAGGQRALGDALADRPRRLDVAAGLQGLAHLRLDGRGGGEHAPAARIDDLRVDVPRRAVHAQARRAQLAYAPADALGPARALLGLALRSHAYFF